MSTHSIAKASWQDGSNSIGSKMRSLIMADPGVPKENPTKAFWQEPPHRLATIQSPNLQEKVDIAVIGSGITACSVATELLSQPEHAKSTLTVFEARELTSGATGRNGGHLITATIAEFSFLEEMYGTAAAAKIARFCTATLEKMHEVGSSNGKDIKAQSETRRVEGTILFMDNDILDGFKNSVASYEAAVPEEKGNFIFHDQQQTREVSLNHCVLETQNFTDNGVSRSLVSPML